MREHKSEATILITFVVIFDSKYRLQCVIDTLGLFACKTEIAIKLRFYDALTRVA